MPCYPIASITSTSPIAHSLAAGSVSALLRLGAITTLRHSHPPRAPRPPLRAFHSSSSQGWSADAGLFGTRGPLDTKRAREKAFGGGGNGGGKPFSIPQNVRQKVISASDAVSLIRSFDTVTCSGFVCQGVPEAILKALGEHYDKTGAPNNLTLLFGGGPGDWASRGLNHLARIHPNSAHPPMLRRTIGSHYGQVPKVADLAVRNVVEAWTLPMGSVSRMIRAQSTHSPGHITDIGIGTFVDPRISGGAANEAARRSPLHEKLVSRVRIEGSENLMYKALPINVAIIRGTTADSKGNITVEEESLLADQKIMAMAAKNSGGIVIAQVKRLAAEGSFNPKSVEIPSALVDCVVVVDPADHAALHPMSFVEEHNPALTGELKSPQDEFAKMPLDVRKIIARRAFFQLTPDAIVNLGIGLPEGVANVAAEEGMLKHVTLSTEPGVFGGLPASGHSFGPAINASALVEMNQMFDFYNGGGLDICFLGAAQISQRGDINVSRMCVDRLTGPGGFIDISQSTGNICFMSPMTTKGLELSLPGDGSLKIEKEGSVKKFVPEVFEKTFSGDEAVRRGQQVFYITERAVFRRTAKHEKLELIEIASGVDLQKDVLSVMEFEPVVSPDLKVMDPRIFKEPKMGVLQELFGSLEDRCWYHEADHVMYLDLFGITLNSTDDIDWFYEGLISIISPLVEGQRGKGPIEMVVKYDGFDLRKGLEDDFKARISILENRFYRSVKRYSGGAFHRALLGNQLQMSEWDTEKLYDQFNENGDGGLSVEKLRNGMAKVFRLRLTPNQIRKFQRCSDEPLINRSTFSKAVEELLQST